MSARMDYKIILILFLLKYCKDVEGSTYISNGFECDMCPPGTHWVADCKNGNRRSECRNCPDGSYSESYNIASRCEKCRQKGHCPQGTILINACSATTNNRCECPDGQYWVIILGGDGACEPHRICKENEVIVKRGTATTDAECGSKPTNKKESNDKRPPGTDGDVNYVLRPPGNDDAKGGSNRKLVVPTVLIMCLCAYAIFRMFKKYRARVIHRD